MRDARRGQHARGDRRVNFFRHAPPAFDGERERRWRDVLAPYYDGFDITAEASAMFRLARRSTMQRRRWSRSCTRRLSASISDCRRNP